MDDKLKITLIEQTKHGNTGRVFSFGGTTSLFNTPGLRHEINEDAPITREQTEDVLGDHWVLLALLFIIGGFALDRTAPLIALGCGLLFIILLGKWWRIRALDGVSYERQVNRTHVFPGETVDMTLIVKNDKALPLSWLHFHDRVPHPPNTGTELNRIIGEVISATHKHYTMRHSYALHSHERIDRQLTFQMKQRGYYGLGPVQYQSGDLFTLYTIDQWHDYKQRLVVYPKLWPLNELDLPAKELFGELRTRRSLFTDPIKTQSIRDYQPQDRFRDVHWKATARRGTLQSKVYDPSTGMTVVVFVNVATFAKYWEGQNPEQLERVVSVAASIANYGAQQKWGIGLVANGSLPQSDQAIRVRPGRAPSQLLKILEALAAIKEFPTSPIETLMHRESPRLPWAATFVVVTAMVTEQMLLGLIQLKRSGRRITIIALTPDPPPQVEGITLFHIPATLPAFQEDPTTATSALQTILTNDPISLELDPIGGQP